MGTTNNQKKAMKQFLYAIKNCVMAMDVDVLKDDQIDSVINSFINLNDSEGGESIASKAKGVYYTSATQPENPENGDLWLNSEDNQLYIYVGITSNWQPVVTNAESAKKVVHVQGQVATLENGMLGRTTENDQILHVVVGSGSNASWREVIAKASSVANISDAQPASASSGALFFNSTTKKLTIYYNNKWYDGAGNEIN